MAGAAVGLIGAGIQAIGASKRGKAEAHQRRMQALENRLGAVDALREAREEESNFRKSARRALLSARATASASGVSIEGSALDALSESARAFETDALRIREKGARRAAALKRGAQSLEISAQSASAAGTLGALGAGFSGLGSFIKDVA